MTKDQKIIRAMAGLLELAKQLGGVGTDRATRWRERAEL